MMNLTCSFFQLNATYTYNKSIDINDPDYSKKYDTSSPDYDPTLAPPPVYNYSRLWTNFTVA